MPVAMTSLSDPTRLAWRMLISAMAWQQKLGKDLDTETAALCGLTDAIVGYLRRRPLAAAPHAAWVRTQNDPVYAPEHLAEHRTFTSVLTVTYRSVG